MLLGVVVIAAACAAAWVRKRSLLEAT